MKKIVLVVLSFLLYACGEKDNLPKYVSSAKTDIQNAIVANIIRNTDFKCDAIQDKETSIWTLGCFSRKQSGMPSPFILFSIVEDQKQSNPPFKYELFSLNGKAMQYAENEHLQMFKIKTDYSSKINIDNLIKQYLELSKSQ